MNKYKAISYFALIVAASLFSTAPAQARFLQTDPVGYQDDLDWYNYVQEDPTNKTDPSGKAGSVPDSSEQTDAIYNATLSPEAHDFVLDSTPGISEIRSTSEFLRNPSWTNAAIVGASIVDLGGLAKIGREIKSLDRAATSLERNAAEHEARAAAFRANPTVRPGMEKMSQAQIAAQQEARAQHLEREAAEFRKQAAEARQKAQELRDKVRPPINSNGQ